MVLISDILPTGLECGVLNAKVQPGSTVAIIGSGPIGLAALFSAQFYSPAQIIMIDQDDNRLSVAKGFGATATVNSGKEDVVAFVKSRTDGLGVDAAIEAVGIPATFELCQEIIAPGGTIANIGVHGMSIPALLVERRSDRGRTGTKCDLHLERLWDHNISVSFATSGKELERT
jgi:alcohol dehydrogenase